MSELITIEISNHVADVRLNRPDKMNALNLDMLEAITATGEQLAQDKTVRAIVLSGQGRAFCAGLDTASFTDPKLFADPFGNGKGGSWPNYYQRPAYIWKQLPVPVICALHGVAYGGGLQIALGADIRIGTPDLQLSVMEIKWGLIPDMSASQTLRDLVRLDVAKELTFTGRIVPGEEAKDLGLLTAISDNPLDTALEMAKRITQHNPDAITLGKYLLDNTRHGDHLSGLEVEEALQTRLIKSRNQIEAVMATIQKREAKYQEREIADYTELA